MSQLGTRMCGDLSELSKVGCNSPNHDQIEAKPFWRRIVNATTVSEDFSRFCSLLAIAASGGIIWYAYTHPFDRETYIQSLSNPTAYEMEGLTPKQVFVSSCCCNAIDCSTYLFDEQNL